MLFLIFAIHCIAKEYSQGALMRRERYLAITILLFFLSLVGIALSGEAALAQDSPSKGQKQGADAFAQGDNSQSNIQDQNSVHDYDLKEKRDLSNKELQRLHKKLKFDYEVSATNLWFFPVATVGSAGLGYAMILVPPENWWKTFVHVYGWAGIGSAAVALGLSFYAIYDYNHSKARWQRFQELYGDSVESAASLRQQQAWRVARAKSSLGQPREHRILYSSLRFRIF